MTVKLPLNLNDVILKRKRGVLVGIKVCKSHFHSCGFEIVETSGESEINRNRSFSPSLSKIQILRATKGFILIRHKRSGGNAINLFTILQLNSVVRLETKSILNFRDMRVCDTGLRSGIYLSHDFEPF